MQSRHGTGPLPADSDCPHVTEADPVKPLSEQVGNLVMFQRFSDLAITWTILVERIPPSDRREMVARQLVDIQMAGPSRRDTVARKILNEHLNRLSVWLEGYEAATAPQSTTQEGE